MKPFVLSLVAFALLAPAIGAAKTPRNPTMTGKQEHGMANCPSTVPTAETRLADRKDGITLTVSGTNATAVREIQRRASQQANVAQQPARGAIEHTGDGTGSGKFGFCPGMEQGSVMTVDDLPDGARIVVRAQDGTDVAQLQRSTRARLARLAAKREP